MVRKTEDKVANYVWHRSKKFKIQNRKNFKIVKKKIARNYSEDNETGFKILVQNSMIYNNFLYMLRGKIAELFVLFI